MVPRLRRLVDALIPYEPERIYLFGSWATGGVDDLSDVDLVVIKRTSAAFFDRLREVRATDRIDAGMRCAPPGEGTDLSRPLPCRVLAPPSRFRDIHIVQFAEMEEFIDVPLMNFKYPFGVRSRC